MQEARRPGGIPPGTNKFRLTIPHEIKPCVIDAPFDADALTQHAVKH